MTLNLVQKLIDIHSLNSEAELVRWYAFSKINKMVMLKRKENYSKQRGDRYLLMPVLRDLESFNFSNTKDFFVQDGVKDFELNEKDYCIYLENLYKNYENSLRKDLFLE
ncbi:MAG TPA: hypothetical protein VJB35_03635 [Candidatus Nanoarchaeia archaeon]|nr:hypothetical protein [Candidatus Nanoarchaeia archaeon]